MSTFPLCSYLHDDGHQCRSAAVRGRQFCLYHLRHRGRLMKMAQSRALNERFQLFLPPPEDPAAIHSALTQVIEALAADMIEPSRARALISGLRLCLQSLKKKDSWHDSAYHCDEPVDYENFEADYNLPKDLDITQSPESAFPPAAKEVGAPPFSAASADERVGSPVGGPQFPSVGNCGELGGPQLPDVGNCGDIEPDLAAEAQHIINISRGLPPSNEDITRFGSCVTPLDAEMMEVRRTQGQTAALKIQEQFEKNEHRRVHRRQSSADRERYALISMQRNLQAAIERHAKRLAAAAAPKKPVASETKSHTSEELTPTGSIG